MTHSARRSVAGLGIALALVLAPTLTGCGMLEGIIEQATGGEVDVSMGSLPETWPAEVPVIDGEIIFGGTAEAEAGQPIWNVTVKVENEAVFDEIAAQLESAGFTPVDAGELDGGDSITSGAFKNDTYGVLVAVTGTEGNYLANYTVALGEPVAS